MENSKEIVTFSEDQEKKICDTFCQGLTSPQRTMFLQTCIRTRLDPFMNQICVVPRNSKNNATGKWEMKITIQTMIDGYRLIAERTNKYMPGKEYTFEYKGNSPIPFSATAHIKKYGPDKTWHDVSHTVYWNEYAPMKEGRPTGQWGKMPHVMLGKCAEAACLRKAFPNDMSGVYTKEEMEQDGENTISVIPVVEPEKTTLEQPQESPQESLIGQPKEKPPEEILELLDADQIAELESIVHPMDMEYKIKMFHWIAGRCSKEVHEFKDVPKKFFGTCLVSANKRRDELNKQNLQHIEKENPLN
jgi:phage recombination protein Bet